MRLADELPGHRIVDSTSLARELKPGQSSRCHTRAHSAGANEVARDRKALLMEHPPAAYRPAAVDLTDAIAVGDVQIGHELLAELLGTIKHLDPVNVEVGLVKL